MSMCCGALTSSGTTHQGESERENSQSPSILLVVVETTFIHSSHQYNRREPQACPTSSSYHLNYSNSFLSCFALHPLFSVFLPDSVLLNCEEPFRRSVVLLLFCMFPSLFLLLDLLQDGSGFSLFLDVPPPGS